jgi:NitT/TauT family transport system substrate-binding protein
MRRAHAALRGVVAALALLALGILPATAQQNLDVVRLTLNPATFAYLPLFTAVDRGYFAEQHIDLQISKISGSSIQQLPRLARGDIDIMPTSIGPGFFNQYAQGFDAKIVASFNQSRAGWQDPACILVRQDLWDSHAIAKLTDLRGKVIDGGADGTSLNFLIKSAIVKAGLTQKEVQFAEKFRTIPDAFAAFKNGAADVQAMTEPLCTQWDLDHVAHRWLTAQDVIPGFQPSYIAVGGTFLKEHRSVAIRFLTAYLKGPRDVTSANGRWTPALIASATKWTEIPAATLERLAGPSYAGQMGAIDTGWIDRQQRFWVAEGTVPKAALLSDIVDASLLDEARRAAR